MRRLDPGIVSRALAPEEKHAFAEAYERQLRLRCNCLEIWGERRLSPEWKVPAKTWRDN